MKKQIERLDYDEDVREPANDERRIKFRKGWRYGVKQDRKPYGSGVLDRLTWENLGYRMGVVLKGASDEFIDTMFALCAMLQIDQESERFRHDSKNF